MRERIAAAKQPNSPWDGKIGAGRLQDIELFAQAALLTAGSPSSSIEAGIEVAGELGWVDKAGQVLLTQAYKQSWSLQLASRLLSEDELVPAKTGQAGTKFLLKVLTEADLKVALSDGLDGAEQALLSQYEQAGEQISKALAILGDRGADE
jgi:glutamate-ammonia-ligase adenylyltransferase